MDLGENKIQHDEKRTRSRVKIAAMARKGEQWTIAETLKKKEHSTKDLHCGEDVTYMNNILEKEHSMKDLTLEQMLHTKGSIK